MACIGWGCRLAILFFFIFLPFAFLYKWGINSRNSVLLPRWHLFCLSCRQLLASGDWNNALSFSEEIILINMQCRDLFGLRCCTVLSVCFRFVVCWHGPYNFLICRPDGDLFQAYNHNQWRDFLACKSPEMTCKLSFVRRDVHSSR